MSTYGFDGSRFGQTRDHRCTKKAPGDWSWPWGVFLYRFDNSLLHGKSPLMAQSERPEMVCPLSAFAAKRTARLTSADPLRR
jgi:hypothetical protein